MIETGKLLLILLFACIPLAGLLYALIVRQIRQSDPALLQRIDPHGFRAMNASSQLRFNRYLYRRTYRELQDPKLLRLFGLCYWLFVCYALGWLVFFGLMLLA